MYKQSNKSDNKNKCGMSKIKGGNMHVLVASDNKIYRLIKVKQFY